MTFDVEIAGATRHVTVRKDGEVWRVDVDGQPHVVDARPAGDGVWTLLVGDPAAPRASVDVALAAHRAPGGFDVHLQGRTVPLHIRRAGAFGRRGRDAAGPGAAGPQRIVSPMPGKIVRVLVAPGDAVTARQGLVVVEAMKMENELRAGRDGRVREVLVSQGQSVEAGAVLLVVE